MTTGDPQFEGVYGPYTITSTDRLEVQRYRISLLVAGLAMTAALVHWWQFGDRWAWIWLLPLMAGLGLALHWIHIYVRPLHNALKLFWLMGCLGWGLLLTRAGPDEALAVLVAQPLWILAIGPLFAALAGIGFKEFFCFRRPEAIGLTLLSTDRPPWASSGHHEHDPMRCSSTDSGSADGGARTPQVRDGGRCRCGR